MHHVLRCHEIIDADFVRGENAHLYDRRGDRYVDFESGIWCAGLGHNHPRIVAALREQAEQLVHLGTRFPSRLAEQAATAVLDVTRLGDGACVFLSSGSEAVEFAARAARRVTGRELLLTFRTSYLAAFGSAGEKRAGEWHVLDGTVPRDADPEAGLRDVPFDRIGGFVLEPGGSGSGFLHFPARERVDAIARRVRAAGGVIVSNEITTGMGRTGTWFGFEHYDVEPDIVALGKGLGNGYPVSAVAMKRNVSDRLEQGGLAYAQSHQNDPLGCAVALAVIAEMREGCWIERGRALGERFLAALGELELRHARVAGARGRGMLLALELDPQRGDDVAVVFRQLLERRLLVNYYSAGHLLRFDPALTIDEADVFALLKSLDEILAT